MGEFPEIGDGGAVGGQAREALAGGDQGSAGFGGQVEQARELVDFLGFKGRSFDAQASYGAGGVGDVGEVDANCRAARGGLGLRCGAQVVDALGGFG